MVVIKCEVPDVAESMAVIFMAFNSTTMKNFPPLTSLD